MNHREIENAANVRKSNLVICKEILKSIKSAVRREGYKDVELQIHDDPDCVKVVVFIKRLTKKKENIIEEAANATPTFWNPNMRKHYTDNGHTLSFYPKYENDKMMYRTVETY